MKRSATSWMLESLRTAANKRKRLSLIRAATIDDRPE
jgi:hypothetical protein